MIDLGNGDDLFLPRNYQTVEGLSLSYRCDSENKHAAVNIVLNKDFDVIFSVSSYGRGFQFALLSNMEVEQFIITGQKFHLESLRRSYMDRLKICQSIYEMEKRREHGLTAMEEDVLTNYGGICDWIKP
jgi:hypothetical protein